MRCVPRHRQARTALAWASWPTPQAGKMLAFWASEAHPGTSGQRNLESAIGGVAFRSMKLARWRS